MTTPTTRLADRLLCSLVPPATAGASCRPDEFCVADASCKDTGHRTYIFTGRCTHLWGACCVPQG
ncbi:hypothetical protein Afil01_34560 [Actinorhabdospora filicis]|uniref:Uncharacterized protein n=1 Tax=Actinorhabdospora filicis TaxID=1785913 RepID=A0A9W6W9I0_9ACTN|nr:hypothetical protein [Actinorhabdospora filicis]GLZ78649.1 hypothetical protein Afil01_34560 [Actinorhabdospora filicis]